MDHSDEFMSTATSNEYMDETNLATQGSLDVPVMPIRNRRSRTGGTWLT